MNRMQLELIHEGISAKSADLWGRNNSSIIQFNVFKFCMGHIKTVDSVCWGILCFRKTENNMTYFWSE